MKRYSYRRNSSPPRSRQSQATNGFGSPAGVEMKDMHEIANAIGSPPGVEMKDFNKEPRFSGDTSSASRVVSPLVAIGTSSSDDSPPPILQQVSSESTHYYDAQNMNRDSPDQASPYYDSVSTPQYRVDPYSYQTPAPRTSEGTNLSNVSSATNSSLFRSFTQFTDMSFSPDFSSSQPGELQPILNDETSDKSSDTGSVKDPFAEQIETLNNLLTTPVRELGALADTNFSPGVEDDDLDQEIQELEGNSQLLSRELSQVDWSNFKKSSDAVSPASPQPQRPDGQMFSPSPGQPSDVDILSPIPINSSNITPVNIPSDEKTPRQKKPASPSFPQSLSTMFGFRKTPKRTSENQLGIVSKRAMALPESQADGVREEESVNSSSLGLTSTSGDSIFQSLANFSSMYGDQLPTPEKPSLFISTEGHGVLIKKSDLTSKSIAETAEEGARVQPVRVERKTGSSIFERPLHPDDELFPNVQLSSGKMLTIDSYDAGVELSLPSIEPSTKVGDQAAAQPRSTAHGLPSPVGLASPIIYADDDHENDAYLVSEETPPSRKLDYSSLVPRDYTFDSMEQCAPTPDYTTDHFDSQEKLPGKEAGKTEENSGRFDLTSRQICFVCLLGFAVVVCALIIALFTTDVMKNWDDENSIDAPTGFATIAPPSYSPTISLHPTASFAPSPAPTTSEPSSLPTNVIQKFDTSYNILVHDGITDSVPSSDYTPDLIESMDQLSLEVLENMDGGTVSLSGFQRRLTMVSLPSSITNIKEYDCPEPNGLDRCETITAEIYLNDPSETLPSLRGSLEEAIENGGLQFQLSKVNPQSPVSILQSIGIGPTAVPTETYSGIPTVAPTKNPSKSPSLSPTKAKSGSPTSEPTVHPTRSPSFSPTKVRSDVPTFSPTGKATRNPSKQPTKRPSLAPSSPLPTKDPTTRPTAATSLPSNLPSERHSNSPTRLFPNLSLFDFLVANSFDEGEALRESSSAQHKAFKWLSSNANLDVYSDKRKLQRFVMATLYYSTNGDDWLASDGWLTDVNECTWFSKAGLGACRLTNDIRNLELDYNNLNGLLPPEVGLLSNSLERIVLHGGPSESLDGTIPESFGLLTKLRLLYLPNNALTGNVPTELGRLENILQINLAQAQLKGPIPSEFGKLTNLITLDMSGNNLTGALPSELGNMVKCNKFLVDTNSLSGPIPSEIGKLNRLQEFSASKNAFNSIPSELGELDFCDTISLNRNNIKGTIPSQLGSLRRLRLLDLGKNAFTGRIPSELGFLHEIRSLLDLSFNQLSGVLPPELGNLLQLRNLKLQHNELSGEIPFELTGLQRLSTISLESNDFRGEIPSVLCEAFNITYPEFSADCHDFDDNCPCCTTCCDATGCRCRYLDTSQSFLCFARKNTNRS